FLHDDRLVVVDVNRQACLSLGYTRDELVGMTPLDLDPDVTPAMLEEFGRRLDTGEMLVFESRHRRKDGSVFPVEVRGRPFREGGRRFTVALARDMTEHKRAEEALRQSEERFRGTFENAAVGIIHSNHEGRWLRANRKLCDILGYAPEELLGRTFPELTYPDDVAANLELFGRLMRGTLSNYSLEKRYIRKDGSLVWGEVTASLQRDAAGQPAYCIAIVQDISERKRLEEELSQAHARLELALRGSKVGVWEIEMPDGDHRHGHGHYVNVWEQLGHEPPASPTDYETRIALVHPDDVAAVEAAVRSYLAGETDELESEHRARHKDGSYRWMLSRGVAVRDAGGKPIRFVGSRTDITDLKRAEEALRASEQRFRTFVDHATDALFLQDDQLVVVDVNRQACLSLGYTRDELVGTTPLDFDPDVTPAVLEEFGRRLDTGEMLVFESRHRRKDGSVFPVEVRGRPFWEGGRRFTVALARDMTEHKRAEEALRESERRFRTLAEALPSMAWTAEPDWAIDYVNACATEYTGLTPEQLRGWNWHPTIHPEDLPRCLELWTRSTATGEPYEIEYLLRRADGAFRWHLARAL
ncbi:MAG TPA: PAS domain S-box protein, partial [Gemmatimonadales bacterium]|nr:PAS domain S-box protein [Gemmatimonadales bacterium]